MRTDKYSLMVVDVLAVKVSFYTLYLNWETRPKVEKILKNIKKNRLDVIKAFEDKGVKIKRTEDCLDYGLEV